MPLLTDSDTARSHTDPGALVGATRTYGAGAAVVPEQSRAERKTSHAVADFIVPTGREEEWRFTPVDRLGAVLADTPAERGALTVELPEDFAMAPLAQGQSPRGRALVPADRAAVVASAQTYEAGHLLVPVDTAPARPLRVVLTGHGADRRSNDHLVVEAEAHSKATVVLDHVGSAAHTGNVEVLVGDGADLTVVSLQRWDDDAVHLGQHDARVGRDATYRHIVVTLGGAIVRLNANVTFAGPGGEATLLGVYFADAGQHLEHRSYVDHGAPHCRSRVTYKGALQGQTAHTVWVGDVLIRAGAQGTDTYELNRNLVLTDGARADSVPNLEIETGDITGAGHASSTGRFDDEQLFYLQARGIPADEARRLVVRGFFADVVGKIGIPEVQDAVMAAIDEELRPTRLPEGDGQ